MHATNCGLALFNLAAMTTRRSATIARSHPTTRCALCQEFRALRESHIVPNAYFRAMKKGSNGKLISMDVARLRGHVQPGQPLRAAPVRRMRERLCKWFSVQ